ncbi:MAG TPA: O-antigen ligase family protein [Gaiellaceae bacterium]|nr:O-antigen ligase family protein [Gaiellaceae bacterium]
MNWVARLPLPRADLPLIAAGFALTALLVLAATQVGEELSLALIVVLTIFFTIVTAFVVAPHIAVALTIPIFALIPMLKVLAFPWIGPFKDMITMAAICAAAVLVVQRSSQGRPQRGDFWVAAAVGLFAALYLVNVGGLDWNLAWTHGVRLALEPLALLLVGLTLGDARRTLRWAMVSLVVTAVVVAIVGIAQQLIGEWALYDLGYSFRVQLRTYNDHLRSFGTLDEPFAYAAFLLLALAALLMWFRLSVYTVAAGGVIMTGLFFSFVRTALVVVLALTALWLARKGYTNTSVFLMGLAAVSALVILFVSSTATETRTVRTGTSSFLTVNGRTEAWRLFLNDPKVWFLGHGVGKVGTAAERATYKLTQDPNEASRQIAIDSGYFAVIADVGLLGLAAMMAIFGRLLYLGRRYAIRGSPAGWLAVGLTVVLMIDAITRASFTGFPTAFLALMLAGLAIGAAIEGNPEAAAEAGNRRSWR